MKKSRSEWKNEALSFIRDWGGYPDFTDVKSVCFAWSADETIRNSMISESGSVDLYAADLWFYILREMRC